MIEAALFDYDGTLADTDSVHMACWNDALRPHAATLDLAFYSRHCSGALSLHIAEEIIRTFPTVRLTPAELAADKDSRYEEWIALKPIPLMRGARELLEFLKTRGIRTGIVTGAPLAAITRTLHENGVWDFFEIKVTRENVSRGKPAPDGYRLGLEKLTVPPECSVSFEDTRSGVLAAKAAGMVSLAIPNAFTASHDFSAADHRCDDLFQARLILENLLPKTP
jgi:beta-phosphoglucomutase